MSKVSQVLRSAPAVIFDCDGVLIDTEQAKFCAWQQALRQALDKELSLTLYKELVGYDSKTILNGILRTWDIQISLEAQATIITRRRNWYSIFREYAEIIAPNVNLAKALKKQGKPLAVASSDSLDNIEKNLLNCDLRATFGDCIASGSDSLPPGQNKPHPGVYLLAAQKLEMPAHACLAIEDTVVGAEAAKAAGMLVVLQPNEFLAPEKARNSPADFVLSPSELFTMVEQ